MDQKNWDIFSSWPLQLDFCGKGPSGHNGGFKAIPHGNIYTPLSYNSAPYVYDTIPT